MSIIFINLLTYIVNMNIEFQVFTDNNKRFFITKVTRKRKGIPLIIRRERIVF